ncbi:hypothetical protein ACJMK2_039660 [Sinanodonta woodiana]|uniref:SWIM-type domain-containing protein n=1 Tax=Sinanodonta woodiana TaxID=1069815 RepID=A0ABD3WE80_SINWO
MISKRRLLNDIRKLSLAEQTLQLEAQHKVVCQFAPKFVSFSYPGMKQRLHLATLRTCYNADRVQAVNNDGELRFKLSCPKHKACHHVLKLVKEDCSYG